MAARGQELDLGGVARLADRRGRASQAELTARVGMAVFLGSWAMLFAALFFAYGLLRSRVPAWPPEGQPPLPLLVPAVNTGVMLAASAAVERARRALRGGPGRGAFAALLLSALLGLLFLALQLWVWVALWRLGLEPGGGPYPSAFYGLTVLHALHVAVGLGALGWLAGRALGGRATRLAVDLWALYWHGVGAVWLALFTALYLL